MKLRIRGGLLIWVMKSKLTAWKLPIDLIAVVRPDHCFIDGVPLVLLVSANRLHDFEIRIGNNASLNDPQEFDPFVFDLCYKSQETFPAGATWHLQCNESLRGRFVVVVLPLRQYLTICELQVFGDRGEPLLVPQPKNAALVFNFQLRSQPKLLEICRPPRASLLIPQPLEPLPWPCGAIIQGNRETSYPLVSQPAALFPSALSKCMEDHQVLVFIAYDILQQFIVFLL